MKQEGDFEEIGSSLFVTVQIMYHVYMLIFSSYHPTENDFSIATVILIQKTTIITHGKEIIIVDNVYMYYHHTKLQSIHFRREENRKDEPNSEQARQQWQPTEDGEFNLGEVQV